MATIPATVPAAPTAIIKIERSIGRIVGVSGIARIAGLRCACGYEKSDADQEWYRCLHCSAAAHGSLRSFEVRPPPC
jgi:hypothetical protein